MNRITKTFDIGISHPLSGGVGAYITADVTYRPPTYVRKYGERIDGQVLDFTAHAYLRCPVLNDDEVDCYLMLPSIDQQAVDAFVQGFMEIELDDMLAVDPQTESEDQRADLALHEG
jgi:hypothetical protein